MKVSTKRKIEGLIYILACPIIAIILYASLYLNLISLSGGDLSAVTLFLGILGIILGLWGVCRIVECSKCERTDCRLSPAYRARKVLSPQPLPEKFNPSMRND